MKLLCVVDYTLQDNPVLHPKEKENASNLEKHH